MADTKISALTELAAGPDASDLIPIVDVSDTTHAASGTTKRVTITNFFASIPVSITLEDAVDIVVNATTGTKIGTATSQKLGFFNATPVVQQLATADLGTALSNLGLRASGTAYPITTSGAVAFTGTVTITDVNIVLGTTTGTKIGTATTQKLGFFNATPIVQPSAYTQTYATADKTHAAPTAATLTVADGAGTNDNTIGAITADASVIAAVQEIADEINKLVADVADVKQFVNSVVDDLQALGLVG